jgi:hypothetical protein
MYLQEVYYKDKFQTILFKMNRNKKLKFYKKHIITILINISNKTKLKITTIKHNKYNNKIL